MTNCTSLAEVLAQDGVKQNKNSFFYRHNNITIFRLPPYAQPHKDGLKYASVPVLMQQLLQQQGLGQQQTMQQWPRHADIFSLATASTAERMPANVPRGESLLQQVARAALPPAVLFEGEGEQIGLPRYRRDALLWVQGLIALAALAALLEVGGGFLPVRHKLRQAAQVS